MTTHDDQMYDEIAAATLKAGESRQFSGDKALVKLAEAQVHATLAVAYAISTLANVTAEVVG